MRESVIEAHLVKRCKALGILVRKAKWIGVDGAPDRCLMVPERTDNGVARRTTFWVELKAEGLAATFPNNAHERQQAREHARMRAAGQIVVVLDSIEAVDFFLEQFQ